MQMSSPNVLVVDDDRALLELMGDMLSPVCAAVHIAESVDSALQTLRIQFVDVIVTDLVMPGQRGTALLQYAAARQHDPAVILITGSPTLSDALEGVHLHASDFLLKPFRTTKLRESVLRAFAELQERRSSHPLAMQPQREQLQLETLIGTLDACEHDTCSHSLRVLNYCLQLAEELGYPDSQVPELARAALLHDIGKIGIPQAIIAKPGRLTVEEFEVMKSHVLKGVRILERAPAMRVSIPIVLHHHECYDGTGYPNGTKGQEIPLGARIFSVVDTLDAMTSDRPYRRALSFEDARSEIANCAGRQFDPVIAESFLKVPKARWEELREQADCGSFSSAQFLSQLLRRGATGDDLGPSTYDRYSEIYL